MNTLVIVSSFAVTWFWTPPPIYKTTDSNGRWVEWHKEPIRCETFQIVEHRKKITSLDLTPCVKAQIEYFGCKAAKVRWCDTEAIEMDNACDDRYEIIWRREVGMCEDGVVRWREAAR